LFATKLDPVELHRILSQIESIFACWGDPHLGREMPVNSAHSNNPGG